MIIYEDEIEKMHKFACPDETGWQYASTGDEREGCVAFLLDNRGSGEYVRTGYTIEELSIKVQLKIIDELTRLGGTLPDTQTE